MENITYQSFRKEAEELAQSAIEEAVGNGANDREDTEEKAREILQESVDNHSWIIYTGRAWEIVTLIRNQDSRLWEEAEERLIDCGGNEIGKDETIDSLITRLAYHMLLCEAESWLSSITLYSAGWNMPGYMPDSEPALFSTFESARDYILESLEHAAEAVCDEIGGQGAIDHIEECKDFATAQKEPFTLSTGNYVYWVLEV